MKRLDTSDKPVGVVLAGGRSSRMGEEKTLLDLAGVTLLQRGIDRLAGQVPSMVLSANGDPARFAHYALPVVGDTIQGHKGPLAGVLAGMSWAREHDPHASHILTIASDTPFFPLDLVETLLNANNEHEKQIAIPQTAGRMHPAFGLWPVALASALEEFLESGQRRVHSWLDQNDYVPVVFALLEKEGEDLDPFFNINTPQDLEVAIRWLEIPGV